VIENHKQPGAPKPTVERHVSRKLVLGAALCGALAMPVTAAVTGVLGWLDDDQPAGHSLAVETMHCDSWIDMI
jgi:hypothetical protein